MAAWKKVKLPPSATLFDAINLLEKQAIVGIILITDAKDYLLGTVTDGDIRRALIAGKDTASCIEEVMNRKPVVARGEVETHVIENLASLGNVTRVPILDNDGRVKGIQCTDTIAPKERGDNRVVIMAGGLGTRLKPITDNIPKPLVSVGGKPILERILEQLQTQGFRNITLAVYYKSEMIQEFFGDGSHWGLEISYIHEEKPLGTAGALGLLPSGLGSTPILVLNCDLLTKINFRQLIDFHNEENATATVAARQYDIQVPYGVVKTKGAKVQGIEEKPVQSHFVNAGIYVISPQMLSFLKKDQRSDMPMLIEEAIAKGHHVSMFPVHEYWLDIGAMPELSLARNQIKDNSDDWR